MALSDHLLPEFDHETAVTRRVLERVPFQDAAWKPHAKSMSLGELATHLAVIPSWVPTILQNDGYDMGTADQRGTQPQLASLGEVLETFDRNAKAARELIAATSDAQFMQPWSLKDKGKEVFSMPKAATLRSFLLSHTIHHRGQLSVYLRLRDVPVPSIYGPSADER